MKSLFRSRRLVSMLLLALTGLSALPATARAETEADRRACTPDVLKLCFFDIPNREEITACLRRREVDLSPECHAVMFGSSGKKQHG